MREEAKVLVGATLILAGLIATAVCAAAFLALAIGVFCRLLGVALGLVVLAMVVGIGALPLLLALLALYWLLRPRRQRGAAPAGAAHPAG